MSNRTRPAFLLHPLPWRLIDEGDQSLRVVDGAGRYVPLAITVSGLSLEQWQEVLARLNEPPIKKGEAKILEPHEMGDLALGRFVPARDEAPGLVVYDTLSRRISETHFVDNPEGPSALDQVRTAIQSLPGGKQE